MKVRKILSILKMITNSFKNPSLLTRKSMRMSETVKSQVRMSQRASKKKKIKTMMISLPSIIFLKLLSTKRIKWI